MLDIGLIANLSSIENYEAGETILTEGTNKPYSMFVLLGGKVGVHKGYGTSNHQQLATLEGGDFFGEMSLFLKRPRCATIIALEPVMALKIDQENVMELYKSNPEIFEEVFEALRARGKETDGVVIDVRLIERASRQG